MLLFKWNVVHKMLSLQLLCLMSQNLIVYHKPLVYCALILLSLFQHIISRRDALLIQGLHTDSRLTIRRQVSN